MHVVHLYDGHEMVYDGRGSVPSVVWNLARRTATRGHRVTVVERQWDGLDSESVHDGVAFERLALRTGSDDPWTDLPYEMVGSPLGTVRLVTDRANFARVAHARLDRLDPDVVHVHLPFAANVLATVRPSYRRRLVYTAHLGETEDRVVDPLFSPDAYLAKRCAKTIALNPSMASAFRDRGVDDRALAVVPNGVDVEQFDHVSEADRAAVREEFDVTADVVVLFVGTVTPRKGVLELARAAGEVFPAVDDAELVIVGKTDMEPEYVERVRSVIHEAGLEDRVTFTGFVPEETLDALYEVADVFALPSHEEGSSVSVAEALAAGLPVLGSDIDGIRQQIDHGTHGLLSDPGDETALATNLRRLVTDDDRRSAMTTAIDRRAEQWSWDRVTDDVVDVYREVIGS